MKKPIYLFSPEIPWPRFKRVWDLFPDTSGVPTPRELMNGKIVYEMVRDKQIYLCIDPSLKAEPIIFASRLPAKREVVMLS